MIQCMKKAQEYFPAVSALLIFCGYLKLYVYYQFWDIDIVNYLDFTEIVFLFLNDLVLFSSFIILLLVYGLSQGLVVKLFVKNKERFLSFWINLDEIYTSRSQALFIVSFLIFAILSYFHYRYRNICTLLLSIMYLGQFMYHTFRYIMHGEEVAKSARFFISFLILITFTVLKAELDYRTSLKEVGKQNYTFTMNDQTIKADSTTFFIGSTKGYLIFRDLKKGHTLIYKNDIKRIER